MTIDYKVLLGKYMDHVGCCEGITYVSWIGTMSDVLFTDEEKTELERMAGEEDF
jgi:hypothetical protein